MAVREEPIRGGEKDRVRKGESAKGQPLTADASLTNELPERARNIQAVARTDLTLVLSFSIRAVIIPPGLRFRTDRYCSWTPRLDRSVFVASPLA